MCIIEANSTAPDAAERDAMTSIQVQTDMRNDGVQLMQMTFRIPRIILAHIKNQLECQSMTILLRLIRHG
jgi:hypothetical protein